MNKEEHVNTNSKPMSEEIDRNFDLTSVFDACELKL